MLSSSRCIRVIMCCIPGSMAASPIASKAVIFAAYFCWWFIVLLDSFLCDWYLLVALHAAGALQSFFDLVVIRLIQAASDAVLAPEADGRWRCFVAPQENEQHLVIAGFVQAACVLS